MPSPIRCVRCSEPIGNDWMPDAGSAPWHRACLAQLGYEARVMARQPDDTRRVVAAVLYDAGARALATMIEPGECLPFTPGEDVLTRLTDE